MVINGFNRSCLFGDIFGGCMRFKLLMAVILGMALLLILVADGQHFLVKESSKNYQIYLDPLTPIVFPQEYTLEDRIQQQILHQNLEMGKCTQSQWCDFLPPDKAHRNYLPPFSFRKVSRRQNYSLTEAYRQLKNIPQAELLIKQKYFLQGDCPRNFSTAWLKKVEILGEEISQMATVYNFVRECEPTGEQEEMYLRFALLFWGQGDKIQAQGAIQRALLVRSNEEQRILYWAGVILEQEQYWRELVVKFPYSWHAQVAANALKFDLWAEVKSRPQYSLARVNHPFTEVVELLTYYNQWRDLKTILWANINNSQISLENWFYVNRLVFQYGPMDLAMGLSSRLAIKYPQYINAQVLALAFPRPYWELFSQQEEAQQDPFLLIALARQESGFNVQAKSSAQAQGLMQILPQTGLLYKVKRHQLQDPAVNIDLGGRYLSELLVRYNNHLPQALAAYNAGPHRVDNWIKNYPVDNWQLFMDLIPFSETRTYVGLVLRNRYFYLRQEKKLNLSEFFKEFN